MMRLTTCLWLSLVALAPAVAEDDACYTCAASACYGHYEKQLNATRRTTAEQVEQHEVDYLALPDSGGVQAKQILAAREQLLDSEQTQIKVLYHTLAACLTKAVSVD